MRNLKEILEEVKTECHNNNCQSWNSISILGMERAIEEYKMDIVDKLDTFTRELELENSYTK